MPTQFGLGELPAVTFRASSLVSTRPGVPASEGGVGRMCSFGQGVAARCRQVMDMIHGTEIFSIACPDISRDTAASIADFTRTV